MTNDKENARKAARYASRREKDKIAAERRAKLDERFGFDKSEELIRFLMQFADKQLFGAYYYESKQDIAVGRPGHQFYVNELDTLNAFRVEAMKSTQEGRKFRRPVTDKGYEIFVQKLTKRRITAHLVAEDKNTYCWYINRGYDGEAHYDCLLMVDVDWKRQHIEKWKQDSDAMAAAEFLKRDLLPSSYWEPSTNGLGRHGYFILRVPAGVYHEELVRFIRDLEKHISGLLSAGGFRCDCQEVKGQPAIKRNGLIERAGLLAKVPRVQTEADRASLLAVTPLDYRKTESLIRQGACLADAQQPLQNSPLRQEKKDGDREATDCGGKGTSPHPGGTRAVASVADLKTVTDTFERAKGFCKLFFRLNRHPTFQGAWDAYCHAGLKIGNSDQNCFQDCFDYGLTVPINSVFTYEQAEQLYHSLDIKPEDLIYQGNRRLSPELVMRFFHVMTTTILKVHPEPWRQFTVSRKFLIDELKAKGSAIAALKRLAEKYGIVETTCHKYLPAGKKRGVSKKYGLGKSHPLCAQFEALRLSLEPDANGKAGRQLATAAPLDAVGAEPLSGHPCRVPQPLAPSPDEGPTRGRRVLRTLLMDARR